MTFSEAYSALRQTGAKSIRFKSHGSDFIDVWASELISGSRKGLPVIRIQWGNSSSTLDENQWGETTKNPLMRNVQMAIEAALR
jgi:hypothetical protein